MAAEAGSRFQERDLLPGAKVRQQVGQWAAAPHGEGVAGTVTWPGGGSLCKPERGVAMCVAHDLRTRGNSWSGAASPEARASGRGEQGPRVSHGREGGSEGAVRGTAVMLGAALTGERAVC